MADTPMVRAARALVLSQSGSDDFDRLDGNTQANVIENVRAVVQALREPTDEMAGAGAEIIAAVGPDESVVAHQSDARNVWRFMIDVALAE